MLRNLKCRLGFHLAGFAGRWYDCDLGNGYVLRIVRCSHCHQLRDIVLFRSFPHKSGLASGSVLVKDSTEGQK
jgi:hypothetical protein